MFNKSNNTWAHIYDLFAFKSNVFQNILKV